MAKYKGHSIKVNDDVYDRIQKLQGPRETYSEVVDRCLSVVEAVKGLTTRPKQARWLSSRPEEV